MELSNIKFDFILCDSKRALLKIKNRINIKNTKVLTSSPSILLDKNIDSINIEKEKNIKKLVRLKEKNYYFSVKYYKSLNKINILSKQEKLFFTTVLSNFNKVLYKASCLENQHCNKNILFIKMSNKARYASEINPPWEALLKKKTNLFIHEYTPNNFFQKGSTNKETVKANLFSRLLLGGKETLMFRLFILFYKNMPFLRKEKNIFIVSENELLLEKASELALDNYGLYDISQVNLETKTISNNLLLNKIISLTKSVVLSKIKTSVSHNFIDNTYDLYLQYFKKQFALYYKYLLFFRKKIYNLNINRSENNFLFTGSSSSIKALASSQAFQEKKIRVVSFQHGVTAEISGTHEFNRIFHSSSNCNFFATFNNASSKIIKKNFFSDAKPIICGLPKRYKRQKLVFNFNRVQNSLFYLSNNLFRGNRGNLSNQCSDLDLIKRETLLIDNILCKANKNCFYKAYPTINPRYDDLDPIYPHLSKKKINIVNTKIDARYILKKYDLIMCGTATSTLSWAIYSKKPIIFLNYSDRSPIAKEIYSEFSKSFFLINYEDTDFYKKVLEIINQPLDNINLLWEKKRLTREKFIENYISSEKGKYLKSFIA